MSRNLHLHLHADDYPLPFPTSCPFFASSLLDHRALLFPSSPPCPVAFPTPTPDLDLDLDLDPYLLFSHTVSPLALDPFLLHSLGDRVSALELAISPVRRRKYTYAAEAAGRKVKWTAEEKPAGDRTLKWEAEIKTPHHDGFDRKWKWESKGSAAGARKLKWTKAVKGKGWLQPWSHTYSLEEDFDCGSGDDPTTEEKDKKKVKEESNKKCGVQIVQVEDNTAGCVAIKKAFDKSHGKGKKKELSPQDAALLIQMNYRTHQAHRAQLLRCFRDLAVAKAKLKEIRSLFLNVSYRRRIAHDSEERQRFAEKIIVLLLTVDALEGLDYMVRNAKRSMLEELEMMLEIVDPQPPGKPRTLSRRKFDLPEGGVIPNEMRTGVKNVIKIVE